MVQLYELDPIPERIRNLGAFEAGQRHIPGDRVPRVHTPDDEPCELLDLQRRVRRARGAKVGLDVEVQLDRAAPEPCPAATRQRGGLRDSSRPSTPIEAAGRVFPTNAISLAVLVVAPFFGTAATRAKVSSLLALLAAWPFRSRHWQYTPQ